MAFNVLVNPIAPPKPILGIAQIGIVIDRGEPSDDNDEYSKRKHNPRMLQIIPTKKLYHEQKGQPPSIGDVGGFPIGKWIVPTNNDGGEPFSDSGNRLPRGDGGDPT
jgi:hypothetical protein